MKYMYPISILVIVFSVLTCKSTDQKAGLPVCIETKIEAIKIEPVGNPPAEVWKWEADGNTYYYFNSPCCDQYNYLYDGNCEVICVPDGGFTGKGDQKCPDFSVDLKKTLIWKDERK